MWIIMIVRVHEDKTRRSRRTRRTMRTKMTRRRTRTHHVPPPSRCQPPWPSGWPASCRSCPLRGPAGSFRPPGLWQRSPSPPPARRLWRRSPSWCPSRTCLPWPAGGVKERQQVSGYFCQKTTTGEHQQFGAEERRGGWMYIDPQCNFCSRQNASVFSNGNTSSLWRSGEGH